MKSKLFIKRALQWRIENFPQALSENNEISIRVPVHMKTPILTLSYKYIFSLSSPHLALQFFAYSFGNTIHKLFNQDDIKSRITGTYFCVCQSINVQGVHS